MHGLAHRGMSGRKHSRTFVSPTRGQKQSRPATASRCNWSVVPTQECETCSCGPLIVANEDLCYTMRFYIEHVVAVDDAVNDAIVV